MATSCRLNGGDVLPLKRDIRYSFCHGPCHCSIPPSCRHIYSNSREGDVLKSVNEELTDDETKAARSSPARWAVVLALATIYLVWGSTYLAMRIALETMPPFLMAGTRFVVAGIITYMWVWSQGAGKLSRREIIDAFIGGGLLLVGGNGGGGWGLQTLAT